MKRLAVVASLFALLTAALLLANYQRKQTPAYLLTGYAPSPNLTYVIEHHTRPASAIVFRSDWFDSDSTGAAMGCQTDNAGRETCAVYSENMAQSAGFSALSPAQLTRFQKLLRALPPGETTAPPLNRLLIVSFRDGKLGRRDFTTARALRSNSLNSLKSLGFAGCICGLRTNKSRRFLCRKLTPMKPLLGLLTLFFLLAPARAQTQLAPKTSPSAKATLKNGLVVTSFRKNAVESPLVSRKFWAFKVLPPAPDTRFSATLEVRRPGQDPLSLGEIKAGISEETKFCITLFPRNSYNQKPAKGTTWLTLYPIQANIDTDFSGIRNGATSVQLEYPSPFRDLPQHAISGAIGDFIEVDENGEAVLIRFDDGAEKPADTAELVLIFKASPPEKQTG